MKKYLLVLLIFVVTSLSAHEFWLMPSKFRLNLKETINLRLFVGEDYMGDIWSNRKKRLLKLVHHTNNLPKDLTTLALKSDSLPIPLKFDTEGTHLFSIESKNSFIATEADKFNDYLLRMVSKMFMNYANKKLNSANHQKNCIVVVPKL